MFLPDNHLKVFTPDTECNMDHQSPAGVQETGPQWAGWKQWEFSKLRDITLHFHLFHVIVIRCYS